MPEIIAHRGVPRERRENTLASFALALDSGAQGIELDVHGTADGRVVVHHDAVLRPLPDGRRPVIAALRYDDIAAFATCEEDRAPTLDEVLALVGDRATVYVEVKAPAIETVVIEAIARAKTLCAVHSFDHRIVRRVAEIAPALPLGVLQTSYLLDPVRAVRDARARDLWQQWELVDRDLVDVVHASGARVVAWTVNDEAVAARLAAIGVDAICTDVPGSMRAFVG
jgi:glycerophosphoryl diester phosphodiesterase